MVTGGLEMREIRAFLVLAEELHFGRSAERLGFTPSYVSQTVRTLETRVGGRLFERTSRRVELTPLGAQFEARLRSAYVELLAAYDDAHSSATKAEGTLRIAFATTTEGPGLTRLVDVFSSRHPHCAVSLVEANVTDPYGPLRSGEADVLYNWLAVDEPDLAHSAPIEHQGRMVAVSRKDPLARHQEVASAQLAGHAAPFLAIPDAIYDAFYPPPVLADAVSRARAEPAESPLRVHTMGEVWALVARGQAIHATAASMASKLARDDIKLLPITDLPPLPLGLIWKRSNENARIRALVAAVDGCHTSETQVTNRTPLPALTHVRGD